MACTGTGDDDPDTDTDTDLPYTPLEISSRDNVEMAYQVSQLPPVFWLFNEMFIGWASGDCPAITYGDVEGEKTVVGDCTDDSGTTWWGSMTTEVESSGSSTAWVNTYTDFGFGDVVMNGVLQVDMDSTTGELTGLHTSAFDIEMDVVISYSDYAISDDVEIVFDEEAGGSISMGGTVMFNSIGFSFAGDVSRDGVCMFEYDAGSISFAGANTATLTANGASECDGCMTYEFAPSAGGDIETGLLCEMTDCGEQVLEESSEAYEVCFEGDATYGACETCGYYTDASEALGDADCITCRPNQEIDVVYGDCTGYCVPMGTASEPISKSDCVPESECVSD